MSRFAPLTEEITSDETLNYKNTIKTDAEDVIMTHKVMVVQLLVQKSCSETQTSEFRAITGLS